MVKRNRSSLILAFLSGGFKGRIAGKGDITRSDMMDQDKLACDNMKYLYILREIYFNRNFFSVFSTNNEAM